MLILECVQYWMYIKPDVRKCADQYEALLPHSDARVKMQVIVP